MDEAFTRPETTGSTAIAAKLRAPRRPTVTVSRTGLLQNLSAAPRVVLVSAPAGFGKTVLVLDWLRQAAPRASWFSLDALDNEPDRFFVHFAAGIRAFGTPPAERAAALLELGRHRPGPLAAEVLNAFAEIGDDAVIILDDLHHLENDSLLRALAELIERLASGPRFILLSRSDPPFALGRLRVRGELLEIREQDLRFNEAEAEEFFRTTVAATLTREMVARLHERTEGWAAGLRLAAVALQRSPDVAASVTAFSGGHKYVVDYLLEEALNTQDERIQRFLMDTSVLPRFTAQTCAAVTLDPAAGELLDAIERANLFLVRLDEQRAWHRYHHLFAELLQFRLRRLHPDRLDALYTRASQWFARAGELHEALDLAAHVSDRRLFAALLDDHAIPAMSRSEIAAFRRWLTLVPDALREQYPRLLVALAWLRLLTERAPDLEPLLCGAENAAVHAPPDYDPRWLAEVARQVRVIRATQLRLEGHFSDALAQNEQLLAEMPAEPTIARAILIYNCASSYAALGHHCAAKPLLRNSFVANLEGGSAYTLMSATSIAAYVHANTDGIPSARAELMKAMSVIEQHRLNEIPAFSLVRWGAGYLHFIENNLAAAEAELNAALLVARESQLVETMANALLGLARVYAAQSRFEAADACVSEAEALALTSKVTVFGSTLEIERAALDAAQSGEYVAALKLDSEAWSAAYEARLLIALRMALLVDDRVQAHAIASRITVEAEPRSSGIALCQAKFALVLIEADRYRRLEDLDAVLRCAAGRGYVRPLLDFGEPARSCLSAASATLSEDTALFAQRLLGVWSGDTGTTLCADALQSLTEREREVLGQLVAGKSNKAIARSLFVSLDTVKTHLKHIYGKLGVTRRSDAVRLAQQLPG